jgi:hypothetical protein
MFDLLKFLVKVAISSMVILVILLLWLSASDFSTFMGLFIGSVKEIQQYLPV